MNRSAFLPAAVCILVILISTCTSFPESDRQADGTSEKVKPYVELHIEWDDEDSNIKLPDITVRDEEDLQDLADIVLTYKLLQLIAASSGTVDINIEVK